MRTVSGLDEVRLAHGRPAADQAVNAVLMNSPWGAGHGQYQSTIAGRKWESIASGLRHRRVSGNEVRP